MSTGQENIRDFINTNTTKKCCRVLRVSRYTIKKWKLKNHLINEKAIQNFVEWKKIKQIINLTKELEEIICGY